MYFVNNIFIYLFILSFLLSFIYRNALQDIQLKLHSKYQLFNINASTPAHNNIDLLVSASTFGIVIVGRPSSKEINGKYLHNAIFFYCTQFFT